MVYQFRDHNLRRYQFKAWTYINQREADFFERNRLAQQLDRYPAISIQHILTNDIPNHLKLERILRLFKRSHNLFGILGAVGSGKTALAYVLLKEVSCYKKHNQRTRHNGMVQMVQIALSNRFCWYTRV